MAETSGGKQCDGKSFPLPGREAATFAARGPGGALKLPQRVQAKPAAKRLLVHLELKIKCMAMMILNKLLLVDVK